MFMATVFGLQLAVRFRIKVQLIMETNDREIFSTLISISRFRFRFCHCSAIVRAKFMNDHWLTWGFQFFRLNFECCARNLT